VKSVGGWFVVVLEVHDDGRTVLLEVVSLLHGVLGSGGARPGRRLEDERWEAVAGRDGRAAAPTKAGDGGGGEAAGPARAAAGWAAAAGRAGWKSQSGGRLLRGAALGEVRRGWSGGSRRLGGSTRRGAVCDGGRVSIRKGTTSLSEGGRTIAVLGGWKGRGSCPGAR
jgi:hypothetical protein